MNLNCLSSNIYVINLKERSDRLTHIQSQLKKIYCKCYTLFEGVNGGLLHNLTELKNGMYGLIKTYLKIYDDWVKDKHPNILIIEDDCIFVDDFNVKLEEYINHVPPNWDMIYFGANHNLCRGTTTTRYNEWCVKLSNSFSAHCVLLRSHVFKDLIEGIRDYSIPNDVMLSELQRKYNAYSSSKPLTSQIIGYSDIEEDVVDNYTIMR